MEEIKKKAEKTAEEVANMLRKKRDIQAIALRGSLVTGHFTRRSDVDLFVITNRKQPEFQVILRNGFSFHVRYYPETFIETMLRIGDRRTIDFIINSKAIVDKNGVYQSLHDELSKRFPSKAYLEAALGRGLHGINDAQGYFEMEEYEAAVMELRRAATNFAEIILMAEGIICLKDHKQPLHTKKLQAKYPDFIQNYNQILGLNEVKKVKVEELMFQIVEMLTSVQTLLKSQYGPLDTDYFGLRKKAGD